MRQTLLLLLSLFGKQTKSVCGSKLKKETNFSAHLLDYIYKQQSKLFSLVTQTRARLLQATLYLLIVENKHFANKQTTFDICEVKKEVTKIRIFLSFLLFSSHILAAIFFLLSQPRPSRSARFQREACRHAQRGHTTHRQTYQQNNREYSANNNCLLIYKYIYQGKETKKAINKDLFSSHNQKMCCLCSSFVCLKSKNTTRN